MEVAMTSVVIYASHFGNTRVVAEAIASRLRNAGPVELFAVDEAPTELPEGTDLLVVGGPIEAFRLTPPLKEFLGTLSAVSVRGVAFATFDTRVKPHWWLPGDVGGSIAKRLREMGGRMIGEPEKFIVEGSINAERGEHPHLVAGELDHAARWADTLAQAVGPVATPA
jgi:flavodoxin